MVLWIWKMCVQGRNSSKKTEYHVTKTEGASAMDQPVRRHYFTSGTNDYRWLLLEFGKDNCPCQHISIICTQQLHNDLQMWKVSDIWFCECWFMKTRPHRLQCVRKYYLSCDSSMNCVFFSSIVNCQWARHKFRCSKWQSAQWKHSVIATEEISGYCHW